MPKVARTLDPVVGEASVCKRGRMSNPSSPLVPQLSINLSPQHPEEPEVAPESSPYTSAFSLLSPVDERPPCVKGLGMLSPDQSVSPNSKLDKFQLSPVKDPNQDGNAPATSSQTATEKDTASKGKEAMDVSGENMNRNMVKDLQKELHECKTEDNVNESRDNRKDQQTAHDKPSPWSSTDVSELRSEGMSEDGKVEGATSCALTGYVSLTARNGDSLLHGVLPPVLPSHQGTALNTCFPASDGNWYQIISAGLPPILSSQCLAEKGSKGQSSTSTSAQCMLKDSSTVYNPLGLLSSLSLPTTTAALTTTTTTSASIVAPLSSPDSTPDSLFSLLQHYTTGTACGTDLQSLSTLHLPLNLASAAVAAAATGGPSSHVSPRYLYATNPRTGQLLILSSVSDLAGAQTLQPLQLQPQLPLQPVLQMQQQQLNMQDKTWKSPLCLKQCQNSLTTTTCGLAAGKQTSKSDSVVNKLLQSKLSSSLSQSGKHDENMPSVAAARDLLALASPARLQCTGQGAVPPRLFQNSPDIKPSDEPIRENHNMKERRRRARIKDACDLMRQLVPGMSEKTDKATVFEFSARYIHFLKNFVGTHHDKDFLIKYSPY